MTLSDKDFADVMMHTNVCNEEIVSYKKKKSMALAEANEYVKNMTLEEAWTAIRKDPQCFTLDHGSLDLLLQTEHLTKYCGM